MYLKLIFSTTEAKGAIRFTTLQAEDTTMHKLIKHTKLYHIL